MAYTITVEPSGRSFEAGYTREYLENITDRLSEYSELVSGSPTTFV